MKYNIAYFDELYGQSGGRSGYYDDLSANELVHLDEATNPSVSRLAKVFSGSAYDRCEFTNLSDNLDFVDRVNISFKNISLDYNTCPASLALRFDEAVIYNSVIYLKAQNDLSVFYPTYRWNDRPYTQTLTPETLASANLEPLAFPGRRLVFLGSVGSFNYGHWLVDDLTRIKFLFDAPMPTTIIMQNFEGMNKIRLASLKYMLSDLDIDYVFIDADKVVVCKDLVYITPVSVHPTIKNPEALNFLRQLNYEKHKSQKNQPERILIKRRPGRHRQITNIEAVESYLQLHGFKCIDPEDYGFAEQVRIFAHAKIIVGIMGASMCTSLFTPQGAKLIYLAPDDWVEPFYWDMASILGHDYLALHGKRANTQVEAHLDDFSVDMTALKRLIEAASKTHSQPVPKPNLIKRLARQVWEAVPASQKSNATRLYFQIKRAFDTLKRRLTHHQESRLDRLSGLGACRGQYFDREDYLSENSDVITSGLEPYEHFVLTGLDEGRKGRFFDGRWYLKAHPDVRALGIDPYVHYVNYGKAEKRSLRHIVVEQKSSSQDYERWLKTYENSLHLPLEKQSQAIGQFAVRPKISIIMPVYNPPPAYLKAAISSVLRQTYTDWELCLADDASTDVNIRPVLEAFAHQDARIKVHFRPENGHISQASNSALDLATGDWIALFDHDDLLADDALFWVVEAINKDPKADIIYSDEDKIDEADKRFSPYFKSDFNYELFLAQNMISHLGVYRHDIIKKIGGFRLGFEGSQDYDLALRALEQTTKAQIHHIPRILYHWRAIAGSTALSVDEKNYATLAGLKSVREHFERLGIGADVQIAYPKIGHYRVKYALQEALPLISIIIPTRDRAKLLRVCIESILAKTTYSRFEIIIMDNGSVETATLAYFSELTAKGISIIRDDSAFNFSRLNNIGARHAKGDYLVLLNNDIEIISPDWLEEMLSFAQQSDVGCVGARLWYPDKTLQHGGVVLGIGGVAGHAHKHFDDKSMGYFCRAAHHQSFSAVTGAALMIKKSLYEAVGGLDEDLAVAFNDVDFCLKVLNAGYRNVWTPYVEMFHHESVSRGTENTPEKQARFDRETAIMWDRWGDALLNDRAYNPNLSLDYDDFSLAWPPRLGV
jgi:O-antigen biosynthesis protein